MRFPHPNRFRPARRGATALLGLALLGAVAATALPSSEPATAASCAAVPPAALGAADRQVRKATLVYDATYLHMDVPGLDLWSRRVAASPAGRRADAFVARCPAVLRDSAAVAGTVPAAARPALVAARRYSADQWGERSMTRLLPVALRRSRVAGAPGWTLVLAGPDRGTWRYVVVDDRHRVVAWQLKGTDARRLFGGPGADPAT